MAFGNKNSTPSFALTLSMKVSKQGETLVKGISTLFMLALRAFCPAFKLRFG